METWVLIPGFEGRYAVSDEGRVYSWVSHKLLKPGRMPGGHLSVALGRGNSRCVHELVLTAHVGPRPSPKHETRHLNGVPSDNRLSNLEWATKSRNSQDKKWHNGARNYKLSPSHVRVIRQLLAKGRSARSIAKAFGVSPVTVDRIAHRVTHGDV